MTFAAQRGEVPDGPHVHTDLVQFVREVIIDVLLRRVDGRVRTWCPQWWSHPEALLRLEGLCRAFEDLRVEPTGVSVWLRDHADYHLPMLTDPDGPFRGCSPDRHTPRPGRISWRDPPPGMVDWPGETGDSRGRQG
jgi:hypothetical protein